MSADGPQASMLQDELRAATNDARHQRSEAAEYVKRAGDCRHAGPRKCLGPRTPGDPERDVEIA